MPKPIKYREFLKRLRAAGWDGPYQKGRHPFLRRASERLTIPNPHGGDLDWSLMRRILQQARITAEEWEKLGRR